MAKFFSTILFSVKKKFGENILLANFLGAKFLVAKNLFLSIKLFDKFIFWNFFLANFFGQHFFLAKIVFWQSFFLLAKFFCWIFLINFTVTVGIRWRFSQGPTFKVWSKLGQWQLRYSRYGQMSQGQMLNGKMSLW